MALDEPGHRVRVDYDPSGEYGQEWLRELLADLEADGLVSSTRGHDAVRASLR